MKKLKLLFFSATPFAIGYLLNYVILKFQRYGAIFSVISILFYGYWYYVGYKSYDYVKTIGESILIGNFFAIVNLILVLFQEVVMRRYMFNILGATTQMFYLPAIKVSFWIERRLLFFIPIHKMWITYLLTFFLTIAIYYVGYSIKSKRSKGSKI